MTPSTLQALRRLLFFSVEEAARMIAAGPDHPEGVAPRSWQYWERGERPVPADVIACVRHLCAWRTQAIAAAEITVTDLQARHGPAADVALVWYQTIDDWATLPDREALLWRPHCSVIADLADRHQARLVAFDGPAYAVWLGKRKDGEAVRGAWAATITP